MTSTFSILEKSLRRQRERDIADVEKASSSNDGESNLSSERLVLLY